MKRLKSEWEVSEKRLTPQKREGSKKKSLKKGVLSF